MARDPLDTDDPAIVMDWRREFRPYFRDNWRPGQHLGVIAPTEAGKTTLVVGLLDMRRFVLALDPKGGDGTLAALPGYLRLPDWPGENRITEMVRENERKGRPSHYIVGPVTERNADLPRLKKACADALDCVFDMGKWTVYVDELQVLADNRMMNLSGKAAKLLVAARSKKVTFVSSFQSPSWVPTEAYRQPRWLAISYTRDRDTVDTLANIMGRPKPEVRGAVKALPEFSWLFVGRKPREPMIITKPPYVAPRDTAS